MQGLDLLLHFFQQSSFFVGHSARVRGRLVARGHGKREIVRIAAAYLVRLTAYNSQPTLMAIITTTKYAILFLGGLLLGHTGIICGDYMKLVPLLNTLISY